MRLARGGHRGIRLSLRFVLPLVLVVVVLALGVMPLVDRLTLRWFVKDLDLRASLIANTIARPLEALLVAHDDDGVRALFARITQDERLFAVAVCTSPASAPIGTTTLPRDIRCGDLGSGDVPSRRVVTEAQGPLLVSLRPLTAVGDGRARLVLVHDMSFAAQRSAETRRYLFYFFVGLGVVVSAITVLVAQLSWRGWMQGNEARRRIRARHGLPEDHAVGVGVDRLDYTKGIEERFRAVERLFELRPEWLGRFTFVQVAAPTRACIDQYHAYEQRVRALAARINGRFTGNGAPAIILLVQHHESHEVIEYYRAAELCFVSSLHDGMNLVAKEFVASRHDEDGVLILSQFTGAARELPEALIVNPYDADQCAAALDVALTMAPRTRQARMRLMRGLVQEFNVFRWAARMLLDAATMRRRGRFTTRDAFPIKHTRASDVVPTGTPTTDTTAQSQVGS